MVPVSGHSTCRRCLSLWCISLAISFCYSYSSFTSLPFISTVFAFLILAVFSFSNHPLSLLLGAADSYPCGWGNHWDIISVTVTSAPFSLHNKHVYLPQIWIRGSIMHDQTFIFTPCWEALFSYFLWEDFLCCRTILTIGKVLSETGGSQPLDCAPVLGHITFVTGWVIILSHYGLSNAMLVVIILNLTQSVRYFHYLSLPCTEGKILK